MTYPLAIHEHGISALIADMRATIGDQGANRAIKSGILFEGVIYAICGHAGTGYRFVDAARAAATSAGNDLSAKWDSLCSLVDRFDDSGQECEILLASRASGQSQLFRFISKDRKLVPTPNFTALGKGVRTMAPYLARLRASLTHGYKIGTPQLLCRPGFIPTAYCLGLTEANVGFERPTLENAGVGGTYYCVFQTESSEGFQPTTVYLICYGTGRDREIAIARYRLGFVNQALVVEFLPVLGILPPGVTPTLEIFPRVEKSLSELKEVGSPQVRFHTRDLETLLWTSRKSEAEIYSETYQAFQKLPFYEHCALGFADGAVRGMRLTHDRATSSAPYLTNAEGHIDPAWVNHIVTRFRSGLRLTNESEAADYARSPSVVRLFDEIGYTQDSFADSAKFPTSCLEVVKDQVHYRLAWHNDGTALLMLCESRGVSNPLGAARIFIDWALVLTEELPAAKISPETALPDVMDAVFRSFDGRQMARNGRIVGEIDESKYVEWFRESVFDKLPPSSKATSWIRSPKFGEPWTPNE